ncbi:hypothetical protein MKJ01_10525 [Chryseobacterium sp. SSA4.19]|uniref:bacteriocin-like protein n=1 Tax=Chryseobacterium sp. SSA4.19 TaxID=2919915 RepID=UPI001F4EC1F2|nr:hypothetical protein [Chryseobacterium sp. SSA4.19]MCJ8154195.1 hypothetical protein [Chryseobacterium sp. SSA4.19]
MKNLKKLSRVELKKIDGGKKIIIDGGGTTCYNIIYCYKDPNITMGSTGIVPWQSGFMGDIPSGATNVMPCSMSPVHPFPAGCQNV